MLTAIIYFAFLLIILLAFGLATRGVVDMRDPLPLRLLRLRAIQTDNDFRHSARTGEPPEVIRALWIRKELYALRYDFECRRAELGKKFRFYHELREVQKRRAA